MSLTEVKTVASQPAPLAASSAPAWLSKNRPGMAVEEKPSEGVAVDAEMGLDRGVPGPAPGGIGVPAVDQHPVDVEKDDHRSTYR